jgi:hypothetical protein
MGLKLHIFLLSFTGIGNSVLLLIARSTFKRAIFRAMLFSRISEKTSLSDALCRQTVRLAAMARKKQTASEL